MLTRKTRSAVRRGTVLACALSLGALVWGAAPASAQTVEVTDVAGRTVTVKEGVERIILGEGRMTYAIAVIDRDDPFQRIAGWKDDLILYDPDAWRKYEAKFPDAKNIPNFGSPTSGDFSVEKAIAVDADVLVLNLQEYFKAQETGIIDTLAKVGIPTVFVDFRQDPTVNTVPSILMLGRIMDKQDEAQEFVDYYLKQMRMVYTRVGNKPDADKPVVFVERAAGYDPNACCNTFGSANLGELVQEAGGINWGSRMFPGYGGTVNPEKILVDDIDAYIVTGANWSESNPDNIAVLLGYEATEAEAQKRLAGLADRPGFSTMPAIQNKQFFAIYHQFYNNPYHFVALQAFAKWLYPEDFEDVDPLATYREMHEKFLPIDYSGLFWTKME